MAHERTWSRCVFDVWHSTVRIYYSFRTTPAVLLIVLIRCDGPWGEVKRSKINVLTAELFVFFYSLTQCMSLNHQRSSPWHTRGPLLFCLKLSRAQARAPQHTSHKNMVGEYVWSTHGFSLETKSRHVLLLSFSSRPRPAGRPQASQGSAPKARSPYPSRRRRLYWSGR